MNYVYHGSNISGLKFIEPRVGTHNGNFVYATKSEVIATLFLSRWGDLEFALRGRGTKE